MVLGFLPPQLWDKTREWPGNEARKPVSFWNWSFNIKPTQKQHDPLWGSLRLTPINQATGTAQGLLAMSITLTFRLMVHSMGSPFPVLYSGGHPLQTIVTSYFMQWLKPCTKMAMRRTVFFYYQGKFQWMFCMVAWVWDGSMSVRWYISFYHVNIPLMP